MKKIFLWYGSVALALAALCATPVLAQTSTGQVETNLCEGVRTEYSQGIRDTIDRVNQFTKIFEYITRVKIPHPMKLAKDTIEASIETGLDIGEAAEAVGRELKAMEDAILSCTSDACDMVEAANYERRWQARNVNAVLSWNNDKSVIRRLWAKWTECRVRNEGTVAGGSSTSARDRLREMTSTDSVAAPEAARIYYGGIKAGCDVRSELMRDFCYNHHRLHFNANSLSSSEPTSPAEAQRVCGAAVDAEARQICNSYYTQKFARGSGSQHGDLMQQEQQRDQFVGNWIDGARYSFPSGVTGECNGSIVVRTSGNPGEYVTQSEGECVRKLAPGMRLKEGYRSNWSYQGQSSWKAMGNKVLTVSKGSGKDSQSITLTLDVQTLKIGDQVVGMKISGVQDYIDAEGNPGRMEVTITKR